MPTLTATLVPLSSWARLDVDFSDLASPYVRVVRVNEVTGEQQQVRYHGSSSTGSDGLDYQNVSRGQTVLYDQELPLDTPVHYVATAILSQVNVTDTFESYLQPWTAANGATLARRLEGNSAYATMSLAVISTGTNNPRALGERLPVTAGTVLTLTGIATQNAIAAPIRAVAIGVQWLDAALAVLSTSTIAGTAGAQTEATVTGNVTAPASTVYAVPLVQTTGTPVAANNAAVLWPSILVQTQAGTATSATVVAASAGSCWLKDPVDPGNSIRVDYEFDPRPECTPTTGVVFGAQPAPTYPANSSTFTINNQREPVTVAKLRGSATGTLVLIARTVADRDRILAACVGGYPLLWQPTPEVHAPSGYLAIDALQVAELEPDLRVPVRVISLPYVVERAPGGPMYGVPSARWMDSCHKYANWGVAKAAGVTWQQAMQGGLY